MSTPVESYLVACRLVAAISVFAVAVSLVAQQREEPKPPDDPRRPRLALRAQPSVGVSPSRVTLTAELVGGANDYQELYCPTAEWDWGDGTRSESSTDCDPYQAGKSEIRRRFVTQHIFRVGEYRVTFRLKRRDKVVASAATEVRVTAGLGEAAGAP
jgi:hypothetical protein